MALLFLSGALVEVGDGQNGGQVAARGTDDGNVGADNANDCGGGPPLRRKVLGKGLPCTQRNGSSLNRSGGEF